MAISSPGRSRSSAGRLIYSRKPTPSVTTTMPAISNPTSMWRSTRNSGSLSRQITDAQRRRHAVAPCPQLFPQFIALDLAGRGLRQALAELDPTRVFPHPDPLFDVLLQGLGQPVRVLAERRLLQHDEGFRLDQPFRIRVADDRGFQHRWVADQRLLDLEGGHPDAADFQHVVAAPAVT